MPSDHQNEMEKLRKAMERLADEIERNGPAALGLGGSTQPAADAFSVASLGKGQGFGTLDQTGGFSGSFFAERQAATQFADMHRRFYDQLAARLAPAPSPTQAAGLGQAVAVALGQTTPGAGAIGAAAALAGLGSGGEPTGRTADPTGVASPLAGVSGWARPRAAASFASAYQWRQRMDANAAAGASPLTGMEGWARPRGGGAAALGAGVPGTGLAPLTASGGGLGGTGGGNGGGGGAASAAGVGSGGLGPTRGPLGSWSNPIPTTGFHTSSGTRGPTGGERGWRSWTAGARGAATGFGSWAAGFKRRGGQAWQAGQGAWSSGGGTRFASGTAGGNNPYARAGFRNATRAANFAANAGRASRAASAGARALGMGARVAGAAGIVAGGTALGAAAISATASVAAFGLAVVDASIKARRFAEGQNESNRGMGQYNGKIAGAIQELDQSQFFRNVRTAHATEGTAVTLARGIDQMRTNWEGVDNLTQNTMNRAGGFAAGFSGEIGKGLSELANKIAPNINRADPNGMVSLGAGAGLGAGLVELFRDPGRAILTKGQSIQDAAVKASQAAVDNAAKPGVFADRWHGAIHDMVRGGPIRGARPMPKF